MIRPANDDDGLAWLSIRNDPEARFWSGQREPIAEAAHHAWFTRALRQPTEGLYVVEVGEQVVGYGRIQLVGVVSLAMAAHARGQGLGKAMLTYLENEARTHGIPTLQAVIHPSNVASVRAFLHAGYSPHPISEVVVQRRVQPFEAGQASVEIQATIPTASER